MVEKIEPHQQEDEIHGKNNILKMNLPEFFLLDEIKGDKGGGQGENVSQGVVFLVWMGLGEEKGETEEGEG